MQMPAVFCKQDHNSSCYSGTPSELFFILLLKACQTATVIPNLVLLYVYMHACGMRKCGSPTWTLLTVRVSMCQNFASLLPLLCDQTN